MVAKTRFAGQDDNRIAKTMTPECTRQRLRFLAALGMTAATIATSAFAQDTRTVVEPKFPAACAALTAELTPVADTTLDEKDETKLDTNEVLTVSTLPLRDIKTLLRDGTIDHALVVTAFAHLAFREDGLGPRF